MRDAHDGADAERTTLLVAEDDATFRRGLRALLGTVADFEIVGEATTGSDAVRLATALQPDVVLMDIKMPGIDGIAATKQIATLSPHIGVLILTMFDADDSVFSAMRAGARGYLLKGSLKAEIVRAIRAVASGEIIFGAPIAQRMLRFFGTVRPVEPVTLFPVLTEREGDVLRLIAQGLGNAEIAERLALREKTVRNHITNVFAKLQVADRAQAIVRAHEAGLGLSPGRR